MSFSAGVFTINSTGQPVVTGTVISSTVFNAFTADIASGLSTCVLKDGTQTITANIPMSSFKLTGLTSGSAATDSATFLQAQTASQAAAYLTAVAGTNTITATATPTATLVVGQRYWLIPAVTNTGATTLQIGANSAGAIQRGGNALIGGELTASFPVELLVSAATPVFQIVSSGQIQKQPTRSVKTSGSSSTYNTPTGCTRINVKVIGGGGGGGAMATNSGTAGNNSSFTDGASLTLTAGGGGSGASGSGGATAGSGGSASGGDVNIVGGGGQPGFGNSSAALQAMGGVGASSALGGAGPGGAPGAAGGNAAANSGAGGGGAGASVANNSAGGGGSGGYVEKLITTPAATYTYTIGAAANGGAAGTFAGGNGAAGIIIIDEFYN